VTAGPARAWPLTVVQGALIGIANIIPGVSGGTLALVLGIYERLVAAIGAVGMRTVKAAGRLVLHPGRADAHRSLGQELQRVDALWLGTLAAGAALAIVGSSRLIEYLLENQLAPTLAFFIGLIVPSVSVPYGRLERRGMAELLAAVVAVAGLVALSRAGAAEAGGGFGLAGLFLAGAVAISAMILPGVSGSFVLMLMGEYRVVLDAINELDVVRLGVFAVGCLTGLLLFVRLLDVLLRRAHSVTMAFLIGLILGSLWVLWPFKKIPEGAKIVSGTNIIPEAFTSEVAAAGGALVLGLLCSLGVMLLGRRVAPAARGERAEN
jgi:putative membrane protein